jgi:hypothetical protein
MTTGAKRVLGTGLVLLALGACSAKAAPPTSTIDSDVVVMPVSASARSSAPAAPAPAGLELRDAVPNVALAHRPGDPPVDCYCAALFATDDLASKRLTWTGRAPTLPPSSLLLATDVARMQCAMPGGVGVPSLVKSRANGDDVEVDLRWRFNGEPVTNAAFIPAPKPGGRVIVHLHGSWMRGGDVDKVETCDAAR